MESRSYMFSTAKKRSTLMEQRQIYFAKDDDNAPRAKILMRECPDLLKDFKECMKIENDEQKCGTQKDDLMACAGPAFRKANTTFGYEY